MWDFVATFRYIDITIILLFISGIFAISDVDMYHYYSLLLILSLSLPLPLLSMNSPLTLSLWFIIIMRIKQTNVINENDYCLYTCLEYEFIRSYWNRERERKKNRYSGNMKRATSYILNLQQKNTEEIQLSFLTL